LDIAKANTLSVLSLSPSPRFTVNLNTPACVSLFLAAQSVALGFSRMAFREACVHARGLTSATLASEQEKLDNERHG
jgi:hypothetical protein